MDEIETQLSEYIRNQVLKRPKYLLGVNDPLISSGLIDSFHLIDLVVFIEESFGVRIEDNEMTSAAFDSVAQLGEVIRSRQ